MDDNRIYEILYEELALTGITAEMVDLTGFLNRDDKVTGKIALDWASVNMRIEDDGDARESVIESIRRILKKKEIFTPAELGLTFKKVIGNMWDYDQQPDTYRLFITTNGTVKQSGATVMGRGCAKEAKDMFPELPLVLGQLLQDWYKSEATTTPPVLWLDEFRLGCFPVKMHWYLKADLALIEQSAKSLVEMANEHKWKEWIVVPWPGCGNGGLKREEVEPILAKYFDERFIVIGKE